MTTSRREKSKDGGERISEACTTSRGSGGRLLIGRSRSAIHAEVNVMGPEMVQGVSGAHQRS